MQLARVYPLPHPTAGAWKTVPGEHDYEFFLIKCDQGWQLSVLARGMNLLVKHGLLNRAFPTRREALQSLEGMLLGRKPS